MKKQPKNCRQPSTGDTLCGVEGKTPFPIEKGPNTVREAVLQRIDFYRRQARQLEDALAKMPLPVQDAPIEHFTSVGIYIPL